MRTAFRSIICLALLLIGASVSLAQVSGAVTDSQSKAIEELAETAMATYRFPSISIAITRNDSIILQRVWGLADLENNVTAKTGSVYRIASVSKPITAVAVMQLVKSGKIALDAPIRTYVPSLPDHAAAITVRQLLTHTSGIRHYKDDAEFNTTKHCKDLSEGTSFFLNDSLMHKPGEKITYSTYGFVLLGLAVEKASGMRFTDYLREKIFMPAGMNSTREDLIYDVVPLRARGYALEKETADYRNPELVDTSCRIPAGGLLSTSGDLARFLIALNRGVILDAESRATMFRNHVTEQQITNTLAGQPVPPGYKAPGFGLGWAIDSPGRKGAIWHGGNQQGATSMLYWVPGAKLGVAVLTNLGEQCGAVTTLAEQIANTMLGN